MVPHSYGPSRQPLDLTPEQAPGLRRSRSKREAIKQSIDNVLGRTKSGAGSPGSVNEGLAQAGSMAGTIGTTTIKQLHEQKQELRHGTTMVVQELDKILGDARSIKSSGAKSTTSLTLEGFIHVTDEADSMAGANPITDVPANPFTASSEEAEYFSDPEDIGNCIENIRVPLPTGDGTMWMRALLDTGMKVNALNEEKAIEAGFAWDQYTGADLVTANGNEFRPIGQVSMQFNFIARQSARTWRLDFIIVPRIAPFDVAFGRPFIRHARLFKRNDEALVLGLEREKKEGEKEVKTKNASSTSQQNQASIDNQYANRRQQKPKPPPSQPKKNR